MGCCLESLSDKFCGGLGGGVNNKEKHSKNRKRAQSGDQSWKMRVEDQECCLFLLSVSSLLKFRPELVSAPAKQRQRCSSAVRALSHRNVPPVSPGSPLQSCSQFTQPLCWHTSVWQQQVSRASSRHIISLLLLKADQSHQLLLSVFRFLCEQSCLHSAEETPEVLFLYARL